MIATSFFSDPAVSGFLVGLAAMFSVAVAYLGYRRSVRGDAVVQQAGIATAHTASLSQVMAGLQAIIDALQKDNAEFRKRLNAVEVANTDLRTRERESERELQRLRPENEALKLKVASLEARVRDLEKLNGPT